MKHFEYEDRLTKKKNQKKIEKEICESLGFDLKTSHLINKGKYQIKDNVMIYNAIDKLGQLEDIEEKLGIDLITLVKLLKSPIYYICLGPIVKEENFKVDLNEKTIVMNYFDGNSYEVKLPLKDYGKTWAFTKEELESYGK